LRGLVWIDTFSLYLGIEAAIVVVIATASVGVLVVVVGGVTEANACLTSGVNTFVAQGDQYETQTWDYFIVVE
jgi:UPF0716 family protein affecting phage T7 exclusion